jgi:hypothetical protein
MADVSGVGACGPLGPFVAGFAAELSRSCRGRDTSRSWSASSSGCWRR